MVVMAGLDPAILRRDARIKSGHDEEKVKGFER